MARHDALPLRGAPCDISRSILPAAPWSPARTLLRSMSIQWTASWRSSAASALELPPAWPHAADTWRSILPVAGPAYLPHGRANAQAEAPPRRGPQRSIRFGQVEQLRPRDSRPIFPPAARCLVLRVPGNDRVHRGGAGVRATCARHRDLLRPNCSPWLLRLARIRLRRAHALHSPPLVQQEV